MIKLKTPICGLFFIVLITFTAGELKSSSRINVCYRVWKNIKGNQAPGCLPIRRSISQRKKKLENESRLSYFLTNINLLKTKKLSLV